MGPAAADPGVVPLIAALGPWLNRTWNRRVAVLLFCLGFAVAAPAMVVSTQMQQLDEPFPFYGPTVVRQAELVPPTAAYTVEHLYEGADDGRNYLRFLTLWQVALARVAGPPGLVLGGMATIVLLVGATWAAWNCRVAYREAQTIGVPL